ncbi:MAG: diguanylate cyclase [Desulfovibrionaceae bacterium]
MSLETILKSPHLFQRLSFPPAVLRLMEEAVKPQPSFDAIAESIRLDPAMTTLVLNLVNSPAFGLSQKVVDLQRAAVVLGTREILKIAITLSFQKGLQQQLAKCEYDFFPDWRLTIFSAIAAEGLAQRLAPEEDKKAYLCCLLKDVSLMMLRCAAPGELPPACHAEPLTALHGDQLADEDQAWGMHHGALSQIFLSKWGIPQEFNCIRHHHDLDRLDEHDPLTQCVILATHWAEMALGCAESPFSVLRFEMMLKTVLQANEEDIENLRASCAETFRTTLHILGIDEAERSNRYYHHSLSSMQTYYFLGMDLLGVEGGLPAVAKTVSRHLKLNWDIPSWDLCLRSPDGQFRLFHFDREDGLQSAERQGRARDLPWRFHRAGILLRADDTVWGELRYDSDQLTPDEVEDLKLYLKFISRGYQEYLNRQAVLEQKAQALDELPVGVGICDGRGRLQQCNQRLGELAGCGPRHVGEPLSRLLKEGVGLSMDQELQDFLQDPARPFYSRIWCLPSSLTNDEEGVCLYLSVHKRSSGEDGDVLLLMEDVTDLSQLEYKALQERDFLERLIGSMRDLVLTVDAQGVIDFASSKTAGRLVGKNLFQVLSPSGSFTGKWGPEVLQTAQEPIEAGYKDPGGGRRSLELIISRLNRPHGEPGGWLVVGRDLTTVRRLEDKIKRQAMFDGLTNLYNHHQFHVMLHREIGRSHRTSRPMGVIFFDLDNLKRINDTRGHQAGDAVLRLVGEILNHEIRSGMDFPCRYGGDEFSIIVTEISPADLNAMAERIRKAVQERFNGKVTLSAGAARLEEGDTSDSLLRRADTAAYQAKSAGGNRVVTAAKA